MKPKASRPKAQAAVAKPAPAREASALELRLEAFGRHPLAYAIASVLLLVPCFWQSRIHAGDLSSHIYNAWLAQLIQSGKTTGLTIVPKTTNVLFDLVLSGLLGALGASAAQRIAVSASVLIFAWGAFYFVRRVSGRRPWALMPVIAILAYGWTFHMGLFNMYVSLGLCLWALGAAWDGKPRGLAIAAVLVAAAYVAHGLPVAWAVAAGAYAWAARRVSERTLPQLLGIGIGGIVALRAILESATKTRSSPDQILSALGVYQAWIYDDKYLWVTGGLAVLWAALLCWLWRKDGLRALLRSTPFHLAALTAAGIGILPSAVAIPGYQHGLTFIAERMSLALGVCACAAVANARLPFGRHAAIGLMLVYFGFLAHDDAFLNRFEDGMTAAAAGLDGQRVISGVDATFFKVDPVAHMVDRICVGRCYSYANYEPGTGQFRIRATGPNPFVVDNYADSWGLQTGQYVVKPQDVPMYRIDPRGGGMFVAHPLSPGQPNGMLVLPALR